MPAGSGVDPPLGLLVSKLLGALAASEKFVVQVREECVRSDTCSCCRLRLAKQPPSIGQWRESPATHIQESTSYLLTVLPAHLLIMLPACPCPPLAQLNPISPPSTLSSLYGGGYRTLQREFKLLPA